MAFIDQSAFQEALHPRLATISQHFEAKCVVRAPRRRPKRKAPANPLPYPRSRPDRLWHQLTMELLELVRDPSARSGDSLLNVRV